jgi:N-glycosylase/DNA lyase
LFREFFPVLHYALGQTLKSGQAFRWKSIEGGWESVIAGRWVRLIERAGGIAAETMEPPGEWEWLREYLQLETDIEKVIATFPKDEHLQKAAQSCSGLRLLKQDPWECLASFILSSTKQIVQIEQIVEALCTCHGKEVAIPKGRTPLKSFPTPEKTASLSEAELRACKMGFRAPYLKGSAEMIVRGKIDLAEIRKMPLEQAREKLIELPGVGRKIADCVLLFAYGFQGAFPVDVWVMKALRQLYFPRRKPSPQKLRAFTETYFGPYSGYAQQYLFHYMRTKMRRGNEPHAH